MFPLKDSELLAQGEDLKTEVMACAEEREQVGEEHEQGNSWIVQGRSLCRVNPSLRRL